MPRTRTTRVQPFVQDDEEQERLDYPNKSTCCVKFLMFFLNITFWFASVLLITIAVHAMQTKGDLYAQLSSEVSRYATDPAILLLATGLLIFVISFAGCLGSLRENVCLLRMYSVLLGLILIIEAVAGFLCYYYEKEVTTKMEAGFKQMIIRYRDDPDLQNLMNVLQSELECCGATGYTDWELNKYFNCSSPGIEACGVPFSCCTKEYRGNDDAYNVQCGYNVRTLTQSEMQEKINVLGCSEGVKNWFVTNLTILAGVGGGLLALQVISYCLVGKLTSDIKNIIEKKKALQTRR